MANTRKDRAGRALQVLVAGGGVAGLEAMLALRALAGERVEIELLTPADTFVYQPLLVAEPFGIEAATELDLRPIVEDAGARHTRDALVSVEPGERRIATASGAVISYDALLVAPGARPADGLPGALTFSGRAERRRFADILGALGRRGTTRLAFVVPPLATWSIAAYELALLTAAEREARRLADVELLLVTHEAAPLELFGAPASHFVSARLEQARVMLRHSSVAQGFDGGKLRLADADPIDLDEVVALPALEVSRLPGLPQDDRGFIPIDVQMRVPGLEDVWAAGDATSFEVKQGGLAAQQADAAARSIAAWAGAGVAPQPFAPVLRAELITGGAPEFFRAPLGGQASGGAAEAAAAPLWSPPAKVAGDYLAPYLSRERGRTRARRLADIQSRPGAGEGDAAHARAMELVLATADADARLGDFEGALRWLSLVEELNLVLPPSYVVRRQEWRRELDPRAAADPVAGRIEPRFVSMAAAISDLQRRIGWLREIEQRNVGQMRADLSHLDAGLVELRALSRSTGMMSEPRRPRKR